jgi:predicted amidohydrolase YtcJ
LEQSEGFLLSKGYTPFKCPDILANFMIQCCFLIISNASTTMKTPKTPLRIPLFSSLLALLILLLTACGPSEPDRSPATMYYGGDILTLEGDSPTYVEALVVRDGKIEFVGSQEEAMTQAGKGHQMVNLEGKTLLPGFIDGHAHFGHFGLQAVGAQLLAPPDATCKDIPTLIQLLKDWNTPENIALTGWVFGTGFDDSVLEEKRFPTRQDLDQVSTEVPILITHISGHFAVVNSKGLEILGLDQNSPDPEGGIIRREADGKTPNGVLEELAAIPYMIKALTPKDQAAADRFFKAGQDMALSFGYTTAQEGRAMQNHELLAANAEKGELKLDVVSYIDYSFVDKYMGSKWNSRTYTNRYRIGGMKLTLDGSPQGRTAWRTQPYLIPPDGQGKDYLGYPAIPADSVVQAILEKGFANNWQTLIHANGDAAIDQLIRTLRPNVEKYGLGDRRNVLIHGQYIREDQLDAMKELGVIASLFPLHTFYWGDWHSQIIGAELGNKISPVRTALNKGVKITIHTDAPVALPNLMRVLWTAVNRTSRSGAIIGEGERLTPYEALQAITIWSAYQHFEEENKGSLSAGKLADLVILDKNPLKIAPDDIKDIQVLETIKEGQVVYQKGS